MRLSASILMLMALVPMAAMAELPPSAYEQMQAQAPEYLQIEVLRVEVAPGDAPDKQSIHAVALVGKVERSASGVKEGEIINISYLITNHPKGWVGPGQIPLLSERDQCVAYLRKDADANEYSPVAGAMSFRNF